MNILHYSLGFPPFRRGGMTKYCIDLMIEQKKRGHEVSLLWPGTLINNKTWASVNKRKTYLLEGEIECYSYEIVNPLPIPLMDGIRKPKEFMIQKEKSVFDIFFQNNKFDVLHIHTFMGLPSELIEAAVHAQVRTIYTTHDYFPVCPRCTLFHDGKICTDDHACADCINCNRNALSYRKIQFLQSDIYRIVKDWSIVKTFRKKHNANLYSAYEEPLASREIDRDKQYDYQELRQHNIELLEKINAVHFNSQNTLNVYKRYGYSGKNANVISISNGAIGNHKKIRNMHKPIHFGYLGPVTIHKGYSILRKVCDRLWSSGITEFEVHMYTDAEKAPYLKCHKPYSYVELEQVMEELDIVIVPSECDETFGFTTLEALSYGIPVITSDHVGAKDLIENGKNGYIVNLSDTMLESTMLELLSDTDIVRKMNQYIVDSTNIKTIQEHCEEIIGLYINGGREGRK